MIIKYNPEGRVTMVLGRRIGFPYNGMEPPVKELNPAPPYIFNRPTDVAFDAAGNIFVADGYVNSRIAKYDKNGRFIKQVGTSRIGARRVHPAACHRRGCPGQCLRRQPQRPAHCGVRQRPELQDHVRPRRRSLVPVHHPRPGTSISTPPIPTLTTRTPSCTRSAARSSRWSWTARSLGKFGVPGKEQGQFSTVHGIDCRVDNEILVSEIVEWRFQKFILHPTAAQGGK